METISEAPGSGEQETLHSRALQDVFFIRPSISTARDIEDFPKTEKQAETSQNEKTEEFDPNERTGQGHSQRSK